MNLRQSACCVFLIHIVTPLQSIWSLLVEAIFRNGRNYYANWYFVHDSGSIVWWEIMKWAALWWAWGASICHYEGVKLVSCKFTENMIFTHKITGFFSGRLFDWVDLIKPVSNVRPYMRTCVGPSVRPQKKFLRF